MSDTVLVAIITASSIIIPQIASTIIKNHHETKIKLIELNSTIKRETINDFIDTTLNYKNIGFQMNNFYKSLNKVLLYTDTKSSKILGKIKYLVENSVDIKEINSSLMEFVLMVNGTNNTKSKK